MSSKIVVGPYRMMTKAIEYMANKKIDLSGRDSSIKFSFYRAKSSDGLSLGTPSNGTTSKHNSIAGS